MVLFKVYLGELAPLNCKYQRLLQAISRLQVEHQPANHLQYFQSSVQLNAQPQHPISQLFQPPASTQDLLSNKSVFTTMPFTRQAAALSRGLGVGKFNQLTDSSADERVLRNRDVGDDAPRSPDDGDGSYTFTDKARTFRMLPDPQPRGSNGYLPLSTAPTLHYDFRAQNVDLRPGEDVLLDDHTIMRIESWEINSGTPCINGVLFQPQSHPGLFMPTRENEFVAILQIDEETFAWKPWEQQVEARRVVSLCTLVVTNKPYQDLNYKRDVYNSDLAPKAVFFCRYMSASRKADAKQNNRERKPPRFGKIEHVTKADADNITLVARQSWMSSISNSDVRGRWRGDTKLDGSHVDTESGRQRYTFAEPFCGAGGVSVGAFNAGLELRWAFDQKEISMQTYRKNFQRAAKTQVEALTMDARDFVEKMSSRTCSPTAYMVDFMHMSPPCQPFAGCNRCADPAKQKEQLRAFNSVRGLLEYCKPRIVTLEEVDSLVNKDMEYWFKDLIYAFIEKGYSLQWKTFSLSEFGVPQTRDRFILIASGSVLCFLHLVVDND